MKRGRRSAADNVVPLRVNNQRPTLTPCKRLSKPERKIFDLVVRHERHLRSFDAVLLTGYAIASAKMLTTKDPTDFEKIARVALSIATKLRLTPMSGMQPVQLGRRYAEPASRPHSWGGANKEKWTDEQKSKWPYHPDNPDNR